MGLPARTDVHKTVRSSRKTNHTTKRKRTQHQPLETMGAVNQETTATGHDDGDDDSQIHQPRQTHLAVQDATLVDPSKLTALSPEVVSCLLEAIEKRTNGWTEMDRWICLTPWDSLRSIVSHQSSSSLSSSFLL
jgi:hypothetical protein